MPKLSIGPGACEFLRTDSGRQMIKALLELHALHVDGLVRLSKQAPMDDVRYQAGVIAGVAQTIEMLENQAQNR